MRNGRRIQAVLFDVDGTLYAQRRLRAMMALELTAALVARPGAARHTAGILRAYRRAHEELRGASGDEPLAALQVRRAADKTGASAAAVAAVVDQWMVRRPLKYLPWCRRAGLERTLDQLGGAGLRLGVLSDYPAREKLAALGVAGAFSLVLCSTDREINALKPSPRGFRHACDIWHLQPEEILYVGDRPEVDGAGASAAGLPCVIVGRGRTAGDRRWSHVRGLGGLGDRLVAAG